jgi:hypothetical protein
VYKSVAEEKLLFSTRNSFLGMMSAQWGEMEDYNGMSEENRGALLS